MENGRQLLPGISDQGPRFPRLSITHLFLLTLTVGFTLALVGPAIQDVIRMPDELFFLGRKWQSITVPVADCLSIGIKLFALIVLFRQRVRNSLSEFAPGHWIFVATGPYAICYFALDVVTPIVLEIWFGRETLRLSMARECIKASVALGGAVLAVRGAMRMKEHRWRTSLGVLAAMLAALSLLFANGVAQLGGNLGLGGRHLTAIWGSLSACLAVAVLTAALTDLAIRVRRDWLHNFALVVIALDTFSTMLAFGSFLTKWWNDFLSYLLA